MKKIFIPQHFFILIIMMACSTGKMDNKQAINHENITKEILPYFQAILDSAWVAGAILVFDPSKNIYYSNDFSWCETGHLPASTFKIPNSIIALETGVMEGDSTVIKWDGEKRRLGEWERDLSLRDAFHLSCVPCFREIARKIGTKRMNEFLVKFDYGQMIVDSSTIDLFWLEGESKISQYEQIDFLYRFYTSRLPIAERTENIMKELMVIEKNDTFRLSGKTGWSIRNGNNNGWFVGYLEKDEKVYFIATNIDPQTEFNMDLFPVIRKEISMEALVVIR